MKVVERPLNRGADVYCTNKWGNSPLHDAVSNDKQSVALRLLRAGTDPLKQNTKYETPVSLLPKRSDTATQMRAALLSQPASSSSWEVELLQRFSVLASRSHRDTDLITAKDAIPELQHILQQHLSESFDRRTVAWDEVEDAVVENVDHTGLIDVDAFIFHQNVSGVARNVSDFYKPMGTISECVEVKSLLRTKTAKRLLRVYLYISTTRAESHHIASVRSMAANHIRQLHAEFSEGLGSMVGLDAEHDDPKTDADCFTALRNNTIAWKPFNNLAFYYDEYSGKEDKTQEISLWRMW